MYLPEELMLEILIRLPVKSLLSFRSVCKTWQAVIDSPPFMDQYLKLANGASSNDRLRLICQQTVFGPTTAISLLSEEQTLDLKGAPCIFDQYDDKQRYFFHHISGPINGIYSIMAPPSQSREVTIMFWNPGNGQFHVLPPVPRLVMPDSLDALFWANGLDPLGNFYGGHGYDPLSKDYKFVYRSEDGDRYANGDHFTCFHVYSLALNSWEQFHSSLIQYPLCINEDEDYDSRGLFQPGMDSLAFPFENSCNWINDIPHFFDDCPKVTCFLVSFDFVNNVFRVTRVPATVVDGWPKMLTIVDGCFAVVCPVKKGVAHYSTSEFEVGVMKEYGIQESWIKAYTVTLSAPGKYLGVVENEFFVQEEDGWVVSYPLGGNEQEYDEHCHVPYDGFIILPFKGSLTPLKPGM